MPPRDLSPGQAIRQNSPQGSYQNVPSVNPQYQQQADANMNQGWSFPPQQPQSWDAGFSSPSSWEDQSLLNQQRSPIPIPIRDQIPGPCPVNPMIPSAAQEEIQPVSGGIAPPVPARIYDKNKPSESGKVKTGIIQRSFKPKSLDNPDGVKITVVGGNNLKAADENGKSDPYCKIFYNGKKSKTKIMQGTIDPVWNHTVTLPKGVYSTDFTVEVWDHDTFSLSDDFLGIVVVEPSLDLTKESHLEYTLKGRENKKDKGIKGNIEIKVHFD